MTPEEIYRNAYATAYDALIPQARHAQVRDVMAEAVAAHIIGDGQHGRGRWMALAVNDDRRHIVTSALVRDLGAHESLTVPPRAVLDGVIKSVATALLDATAPKGE